MPARRHRRPSPTAPTRTWPRPRYNMVTVGCTARSPDLPAPGPALPHVQRLRRLRLRQPGRAAGAAARRSPPRTARLPPRSCTACRTRCGGAGRVRQDRRAARGRAVHPRRRAAGRSGRTWAGTTRWTSWSAGRCSTERLPLAGHVLMVSGRASYEIMQKALVAGHPGGGAVSAPSSLAVDAGRGLRGDAGRLPARPAVQRLRRPGPHRGPGAAVPG